MKVKNFCRMTFISAVFGLLALPGIVSAQSQCSDEILNAFSEYSEVLMGEIEDALSISCTRRLNDTGTGSNCSCSATSPSPLCTCSGSGNQRVCQCSDGTSSIYCYFCSGGSNCECGPVNRSGKPCRKVSTAADSQVLVR